MKASITWSDLTYQTQSLVMGYIRDILTSRNYLLYGIGLETVEEVSVMIIDSLIPKTTDDSLHVALSFPQLTSYDDTYLYESTASATDIININIFYLLSNWVKSDIPKWIEAVDKELTHG